MPSAVRAVGLGCPSSGASVGATAPSGTSAFAPAWPSWIPAAAPAAWIIRTMSASPSTWPSSQMPRSAVLMRPWLVTAVASVNTNPAPPTARLGRWTRCQSVTDPSAGEEYMHIGDTTMRFRSVTPRMSKGSRSRLMAAATRTGDRWLPADLRPGDHRGAHGRSVTDQRAISVARLSLTTVTLI